MSEYNPNPFDFVPFAAQPLLKTEAQFNAMGDLYSGYLEVSLKALTPVHVVGYQEPDGNGRKSHMYTQNKEACIPASSLRGCLRAFMEALTAGWVSQATPEYKKDFKKRHVGFATFDWHKNESRGNKIYQAEPAVEPAYQPHILNDNLLDVTSYLFGIVNEKENQDDSHEALAHKSKVWIEDAQIDPKELDGKNYWLPDIVGEAFMGGAKPSASNWWYMQPKQIWLRNVKTRDNSFSVAEFIGGKYWGRKFYYHQDPESCVQYYDPKNHNWEYSKNPFCKVTVECLKPNASTKPFRIYVNRVPKQLLVLLILNLLPGKYIRHKLGYGKAYGFGSIEFLIDDAKLRIDNDTQRIPDRLENRLEDIKQWQELAWNREMLVENHFDVGLIDWPALEQLAKILSRENSERLTFTYPPFKPSFFARGVQKGDFQRQVTNFDLQQPIQVTDITARQTAFKLFSIKKPIHFRLYQENAKGWDMIRRRKP